MSGKGGSSEIVWSKEGKSDTKVGGKLRSRWDLHDKHRSNTTTNGRSVRPSKPLSAFGAYGVAQYDS